MIYAATRQKTSMKYGRIPIMIARVSKTGYSKYGWAVLIYTHMFSDSRHVICDISSVRVIEHKYIKDSVLRTWLANLILVPAPYEDAILFLKQYCNKLNGYKKETTERMMKDYELLCALPQVSVCCAAREGDYEECPCKELYSMRKKAPRNSGV